MPNELQEAAAELREFAGECWDAVEAGAGDDAHASYFSELAEAAEAGGFTEDQLTAEVERQIKADATGEEAGSDTDTLENFFDLEKEDAVIDPAIKAAAEVQARADLLTVMAGGVDEQVAERERLSTLGSEVEGEVMAKWASGGEGVLAALNVPPRNTDTDAEDL